MSLIVTLFRHMLRTGAIEDLVVVSERQMIKGVSRVVALTGDEAKQVPYILRNITGAVPFYKKKHRQCPFNKPQVLFLVGTKQIYCNFKSQTSTEPLGPEHTTV